MKTHEQMLSEARQYDDLTAEISKLRARLIEAETLLRECDTEVDFEATNCELLHAAISIFLDSATVSSDESHAKE